MNKSKVINETAEFVRNKLQGEGSGHDWWHVYRVWQTAKVIAKKEKVDTFNVELAALLHDIADWKFYDGDEVVSVDPGYRTRLERVLKDILTECINYHGKPTQKELMLARFAVEAVGTIRVRYGSNSPEQQFTGALHEKGEMSMTEAREIIRRLEFPAIDSNELFQLVYRLSQDTRYRKLDYPFFPEIARR